ncbi:MAG TPA: N-formylglutamate amidohydrolase [Beijerinckiaceae bacterium]|nr:N-formylglutamate amidohydrolase [Beijerinckiaceae bacterium]
MGEDIATPFEILEPRTVVSPFLFNSPHSGDCYPAEFLAMARLGLRDMRCSADLFVDQLFLGVVERGIPLMRAHFPRSFLDVNREPYELDPRMFEGRMPAFANTRSLRVTSGFGTIARYAGEGQEIYTRRIPVDEALRRIDHYYLPYHAALRHRLNAIQRQFSQAYLIDCHSMPSGGGRTARNPDVVLGDRFGTSCTPALMDFVETFLVGAGLVVARNQPYAGGFITEHYGNPVAGLNALQIEINRSLYMDESLQSLHSGAGLITGVLMDLADSLISLTAFSTPSLRFAAE